MHHAYCARTRDASYACVLLDRAAPSTLVHAVSPRASPRACSTHRVHTSDDVAAPVPTVLAGGFIYKMHGGKPPTFFHVTEPTPEKVAAYIKKLAEKENQMNAKFSLNKQYSQIKRKRKQYREEMEEMCAMIIAHRHTFGERVDPSVPRVRCAAGPAARAAPAARTAVAAGHSIVCEHRV